MVPQYVQQWSHHEYGGINALHNWRKKNTKNSRMQFLMMPTTLKKQQSRAEIVVSCYSHYFLTAYFFLLLK